MTLPTRPPPGPQDHNMMAMAHMFMRMTAHLVTKDYMSDIKASIESIDTKVDTTSAIADSIEQELMKMKEDMGKAQDQRSGTKKSAETAAKKHGQQHQYQYERLIKGKHRLDAQSDPLRYNSASTTLGRRHIAPPQVDHAVHDKSSGQPRSVKSTTRMRQVRQM